MGRVRLAVPMIAALALGLAVASCESIADIESWFDTKKPLPGERKPVFPEGVPGVSHGVPPELVRGYQAQTDGQPPAAEQAAAEPRTETPAAPPQAKPRPARAAAPPRTQASAPPVRPRQPAAGASSWPKTPAAGEPAPETQQQGQQPTQQSPPAASVRGAPPVPTPWPAAPPPGTFSR